MTKGLFVDYSLMENWIYGNPYAEIGARGAEGGANLFKLSYFHKPAVLAQSPQFLQTDDGGSFLTEYLRPDLFSVLRNITPRDI